MTLPRILITGAAGRTGAVTARELLEKGFQVRAFVRRENSVSRKLAQAGAEIFVGDLNDMRDLRAALSDVARAYYCPPFSLSLLHSAMLFAIAAEEAKLDSVVLMSQWQPHETHPSISSRDHWIANQIYGWMPSVPVIHLNPGLFAFTYFLGLPAAVHFGMLMLPYGDAMNAPASNEDIGRCAAALLANPQPHLGRSYRPTGPRLISASDAAADIGSVLGKRVRYKNATFKEFSRAAVAQGFPLSELSQLRHYIRDLKDGAFALGAPTDHVEQLTGTPAEPFVETAQRYIDHPTLIHPKMSVGTNMQAFRFLLRMMTTQAPDLDMWEADQPYPCLTNPVRAMENEEWQSFARERRLYRLDQSTLNRERKIA